MKLFHLSDLHLGKILSGYSLIEDQEAMLFTQVLPLIDARKPEVLLLSGDLFDRQTPPLEALSLYDRFLDAVLSRGVKVLAISGNHDSSLRVSQHRHILEKGGYFVAGPYQGRIPQVVLEDEYGPVVFYLLSYFSPSRLMPYGLEGLTFDTSFDDAMGMILNREKVDESQRNVLLLHQAVAGASRDPSDTKPLLSSAASDYLSPSRLKAFDYVALGHIHKTYKVTDRIVYPGALLPYHPEESNQRYLSYVELGRKGDYHQEFLPLTPKRKMRVLQGSIEELLSMPNDSENYVFVRITDESVQENLPSLLTRKYPFFLGAERVTAARVPQAENSSFSPKRTMLETLEAFYRQKTGKDLSPEEKSYLTSLIREMEEEEEK